MSEDHDDSESSYGWKVHAFTRSDTIQDASFVLMYAVLIFMISTVTQRITKIWKIYSFPEVGFTILTGLLGAAIAFSASYSDGITTFDANIFFTILLPPIIFNSGYTMDRLLFEKNYIEILIFANIGTLISALVFGGLLYAGGHWNFIEHISLTESFAFGSLISATDPVSTLAIFSVLRVEPLLYIIVLGTSLLDDAFAVILCTTFNSLIGGVIEIGYAVITVTSFFIINMVASALLGIIMGIIIAYIVKVDPVSKSNKMMLLSLTLSGIYITFLLPTIFQLSGIISCLHASLTFNKYICMIPDVDHRESISSTLEILAYVTEAFTFFSIGMSLLDLCTSQTFNAGFVMWSFSACIISRAAFVYPLSYLMNCYHRTNRKSIDHATCSTNSDVADNIQEEIQPYLSLSLQHMIFFAGLRGPVSYAQSLLFPDDLNNRDLIVMTTRMIVIITIYLKGGLTAKALMWLKIPFASNDSDCDAQPQKLVVNAPARADVEAPCLSQTDGEQVLECSELGGNLQDNNHPLDEVQDSKHSTLEAYEDEAIFSFQALVGCRVFSNFEKRYILPLFQPKSSDIKTVVDPIHKRWIVRWSTLKGDEGSL